MKYNKLVRDKIPEIIKSKGKTPLTYIADDKEYKEKLKKKLHEEVEEFTSSEDKEELADILEVIYAICKSKNIKFEGLEKIRKEKQKERGGFRDKIILKEVKE